MKKCWSCSEPRDEGLNPCPHCGAPAEKPEKETPLEAVPVRHVKEKQKHK